MNVSGINTEKMTKARLEFLDVVESLNSIFNRLDIEVANIKSNWSGEGKQEFLAKYEEISKQFPILKRNVTTYSDDIGKVISSYEIQDYELSQKVIKNISKLGEGSE